LPPSLPFHFLLLFLSLHFLFRHLHLFLSLQNNLSLRCLVRLLAGDINFNKPSTRSQLLNNKTPVAALNKQRTT
jgi:hypothetical protein